MENNNQPAPKGEENKEFAQQQPSKFSLAALKAEAKELGPRYWVRVVIGFFVMIFLAALASNAYLHYTYESELENPCKVCLDLNPETSACLSASYTYIGEQSFWFSLRPLKSLEHKAWVLQLPCDACIELNEEPRSCIVDLFALKKETINKYNNLTIDFNLTEIQRG